MINVADFDIGKLPVINGSVSVRLMFRAFFVAILLLCSCAQARNFPLHTGGQPRSQVNLNFNEYGSEYHWLNVAKDMQDWSYTDNSGPPSPAELDSNGYPLFGVNAFSHGGVKTIFYVPRQALKPGNYAITAIGSGVLGAADFDGNSRGVACTGVQSGNNNQNCNNTQCSAARGYIVGTALHITSASSCKFVQYQPISGAGIEVSQWGVPTTILNTNGHTGVGTYTISFSQNVGSASNQIMIHPGMRNVESAGAETGTGGPVEWGFGISATTSGNRLQYISIVNVNDEAAYYSQRPCGNGTACITGVKFRQRIEEGNFATVRDLNITNANGAACTTWITRKPLTYYSYAATELRNASSGPGVFVDSAGDGATGATIRYKSGTNTYSIRAGSGNFADKQTFIVKWPATGDTSSKISLNGNTAVTLLGSNSARFFTPTSGHIATIVFDAILNSVLAFQEGDGGINCGVPPEAEIEMNAELNTNPYIVAYFLALDPMTDYYSSFLSYIKRTFPAMKPEFSIPDEVWNCAANPGNYASAKTRVYISKDSAWINQGPWCGAGGDIPDWEGKVASTLGQQLDAISPGTDLFAGVQTVFQGSFWDRVALATAYVNQNPSNIPIQPGYQQVSACPYETRWEVAPYWGLKETGTAQEVADAYNYFNGSAATQNSIMIAYMATNDIQSHYVGSDSFATFMAGWSRAAATACNGQPFNAIRGLVAYEGTFTNQLLSADQSETVTSATSSNDAVLTVGGCVAGMPVSISNAMGGMWSSADGKYTVQSATSTTCTINLNSSSLGTLKSLSLTYVGSENWLNALRTASYVSPELYQLTLLEYAQFIAAGGENPSLFTLAGMLGSGYPWTAFSPDIYGYLRHGSCTSCTVSGTTLRLGGTVTGFFAPGDTIFGAGIQGVTIVSGTASVSGQTVTISASLTIRAGESMTSNYTPPTDAAGTDTNSPITQWPAIRMWNGNIGGDLEKRDLDPGLNDDTPMWLKKAT